MIPAVGRAISHGVPLLTAIMVIAGCATSGQQPPSAIDDTDPGKGATHRDWEENTRLFADELMQQAQVLVEDGKAGEAMARIEDALCAVLETPPGYRPDAEYLEYTARLLDEAEVLESSLDGEEPGPTEEFVELPPIDVPDLADRAHEPGPEPLLPPSSYPLVVNQTVERFLEAFTTPGEYRNRIENGLRRSGAYLPMIRAKMQAAGLPADLSYLPLIESAFSVRAYSRARAHGMWQFIASTGRHYGLEVGTLIDERRDPVRSTEAAIAYLQDLHAEFDDWHLALAAYNSGAGNVRRAIKRSSSHDFWTLQRYLPRETRNYVPAFIASVIVAKQPERYGLPAPVEQEWRYDSVTVPDALDLEFLSRQIDVDLDTLRELNPAIMRDLTPAHRSTSVCLPVGCREAAQHALDTVPASEWAPRMIHTVRPGDTLHSIASRYGSSVAAIRQANGIRGSLIRPGQTLLVPRLGDAPTQPVRVADGGEYVVEPNDTLWEIARSFDVSLESLCTANGLGSGSTIHPGKRLQIPNGAAPVRSTAAPPSTYTVREGDTLYDIARRFGTSVSAIKRANGINGSRIHPGDQLRIPVASAG